MTALKMTLDKLIKQMTEQECYKKYHKTLMEIKKDTSLYDQLNEYRKRNVELHWKKQSLKEEALLEKEYHELISDERVREFLYWEQETLKMLRKIHKDVDDAMDLDYSFL